MSDALVEMRQWASDAFAVEQAEHGLGIADVDCEEHGDLLAHMRGR